MNVGRSEHNPEGRDKNSSCDKVGSVAVVHIDCHGPSSRDLAASREYSYSEPWQASCRSKADRASMEEWLPRAAALGRPDWRSQLPTLMCLWQPRRYQDLRVGLDNWCVMIYCIFLRSDHSSICKLRNISATRIGINVAYSAH